MSDLMTERLHLRRPVLSDFDAYAAFYASERTAHIGGPRALADAWRLFAADAGHWALMGYGWFTVTERDGGASVGTCGLHHPPTRADVEIGWTLYEGADGKGYATEAAQAVLAWGWGERALERIVSYIAHANEPSRAVARRLGARLEDDAAPHDPGCEVWLHDREGLR